MIHVIGLGTRPKHLTIQAADLLARVKHVYVKTALTPTYDYFRSHAIDAISMDDVYENAQDFDALDDAVVERLIDAEQQWGEICFCVNGSGTEDACVQKLAQRREIALCPGVAPAAVYATPSASVVQITASELVSRTGWDYDTRSSLIVTELDNRLLAGEVKLVLAQLLDEEQTVTVAGKQVALYELDRLNDNAYGWDTHVCVPPLALMEKRRFNLNDLYQIMRILRGENGCPWDREQTHVSIRSNAIEEAYELVEAIDHDDIDNMIEESGDVLLQAIFHCVIGEDCGEYTMHDALTRLCRKLIDRHTHIFGDVKADNAQEALQAWEAAKAKEKSSQNLASRMDKIAKALPAALYAYKVQKAAEKWGFEFTCEQGVLDKIDEETQEFLRAEQKGKDKEMEGGDLLFAVINLLRWNDIDPEVALRRATRKFAARTAYIESKYGAVSEMSPQEFNRLWEEAKRALQEENA